MKSEMFNKPKTCALYARSAQSDPARIQSQLEACRAAVAQRGWKVDESYIYTDDGASGIGGIAERPGLGALMAAAVSRNRPFDCLFVERMDRIGRNLTSVRQIITTLALWDVTVHAVDPPFDSKRHPARILFNILDVIQEVSAPTKLKRKR